MDYRPIHVRGGVIISGASGGVRLLDYFSGDDTTLDLTDQALTDTADVYITLTPPCKYFFMEDYWVGYVDTANIDDLDNLWFLEGSSAVDLTQALKVRDKDIDGIAETALPVSVPSNKSFNLETAGRLYFMTDWGTAVIDCTGSTEYFLLIANGYTTHRVII